MPSPFTTPAAYTVCPSTPTLTPTPTTPPPTPPTPLTPTPLTPLTPPKLSETSLTGVSGCDDDEGEQPLVYGDPEIGGLTKASVKCDVNENGDVGNTSLA